MRRQTSQRTRKNNQDCNVNWVACFWMPIPIPSDRRLAGPPKPKRERGPCFPYYELGTNIAIKDAGTKLPASLSPPDCARLCPYCSIPRKHCTTYNPLRCPVCHFHSNHANPTLTSYNPPTFGSAKLQSCKSSFAPRARNGTR